MPSIVAVIPAVLTIVPTLDAIILAIMRTFKLSMNPPMLTPIHAVIMGLIVPAFDPVMITVMRAFDPVVLPIVPIVPPVVIRERRSGRTQQDRETQSR